ncbi:MAG TPA: hypothetical protein VJX72_10580 [Candidatus Acidoferrum sp.]|nr:hypothetical protein [Candidatus Acidoferrum sp.]
MPTGTAKPTIDGRAFIHRLSKAGRDLSRIAKEVVRSPELMQSVIATISAEASVPRLAASKLLRIVSETSPELVYPHFDFLVTLLNNPNSILRWNATLTLANLASIDRHKKLDRIIDTYLAPVCGSRMIDAANAIRGAAAIARAKPYLAGQMARHILQVESASYSTPECRNVAIGHAITALDQFFPAIADKNQVRSFVDRQVNNTRPATRNKACKFGKKWPASLSQELGS